MADAAKKEQHEEEEEEKPKQPLLSTQSNNPSIPRSKNPFAFWAYLTLVVSVLTLLFSSLPSLHSDDPHSWFLSLPDALRQHHSKGRFIKAETGPARRPVQVFTIEHGPRDAEAVVLIHGLGSSSYSFRQVLHFLSSSGIRAVAIDLPGSGFSDGLYSEQDKKWGGVLGRIWDVYSEIKDKGLFWGFDQLVETGGISYEEMKTSVSLRPSAVESSSSSYGPAEIGRVVGQVIDAMELAPVHLVLHDSAMGVMASWVSSNPGSVRSVTLVDSSAQSVAFPARILGVPVLEVLLLRSRIAFLGLLKLCCSRSIDGSAAEAYRLLLKGKEGRRSVVAAGRALNYSFDLGEWAGTEDVKDIPMQALWSGAWSDPWIDEGRRAATAVPWAKFSYHAGGRWPQEDSADEIAGMVAQFVSSLPKSMRPTKEEHMPEHIQKMFHEASHHSHDHIHIHHHHGHSHENAAGFMNMYGLDQDWRT